MNDFIVVSKKIVIDEGLFHLGNQEWMNDFLEVLFILESNENVEFMAEVLIKLLILLILAQSVPLHEQRNEILELLVQRVSI